MSLLAIVEQALMAGYGEEQILNFISNRMPELSSGIKSAKQSGFDISKILKFLAYSSPRVKKEEIEKQKNVNDSYLSGIGLKTKEERAQSMQNALKGALGVGAGVLGAYGLVRGIPKIVQGLAGASTTSTGGTKILEKGMPSSQQPSGSQTESVPQIPPIQQKAFPSPEFQPTPTKSEQYYQALKQNASKIVSELGIDKTVNNSIKQGKNLERTAQDVLGSMPPKKRAQYEEMTKTGDAPPMIRLLQDYLGQKSQSGVAEKSVARPQKGDIVASPDLVGELKSIRDKEALIESDGKLHKVKAEELVSSPLPEKDLSELFEDLTQGIEKETGEEVSRSVNWAGYDPNTNSLAFLPHDGRLYVYDDIGEDDVKQLTNILNTRKTTGENFVGAWREGSKSPIGSAMSSLIRKLQGERGGKGKEYTGKFETVYSFLEPAYKAKKKKKKK